MARARRDRTSRGGGGGTDGADGQFSEAFEVVDRFLDVFARRGGRNPKRGGRELVVRLDFVFRTSVSPWANLMHGRKHFRRKHYTLFSIRPEEVYRLTSAA